MAQDPLAVTNVAGEASASLRRATLGEGMDHTPPERGRAVRAAGRHTARVRFLRRAMILGSVLGVSVIAIVAAFDPFHHLPRGVSIAGVGVEGTIVTMDAPRISGLRPDGGAYSITARQGRQDITKPNVMELRGVDATVGMADRTSSHITSEQGLYDSKVDTMTLSGHARIKNTGGYDMMLRTAVMNFKTGIFSSRERSTVAISGGSVSADQLDILDNGHRVVFAGQVESTFDQPDEADAGTAAP